MTCPPGLGIGLQVVPVFLSSEDTRYLHPQRTTTNPALAILCEVTLIFSFLPRADARMCVDRSLNKASCPLNRSNEKPSIPTSLRKSGSGDIRRAFGPATLAILRYSDCFAWETRFRTLSARDRRPEAFNQGARASSAAISCEFLCNSTSAFRGFSIQAAFPLLS
jgi:hypothetical protein